ncbi:MAG: helix-turn-helix transcriptional regulator [Lachnospiraceae bacterium]|nr:helix-turn-helix transcriptional regulator [Lachnospiraceae bacterium]
MPESNINSDLIRGHIDTIILRILKSGDNYGYEIMKAVSQNSNNEYELKEPSLYTSLKRLEKQGLITSYWGDESQGGRRKYYHITDSGILSYENALSEWLHAQRIINKLLQGGPADD